MRLSLLLFLFSCFLKAGAQYRYDNELQLTETRFALESQIHGLKWGFLHNMDTSALGINNQGFVNLYKVWKDRPDRSSFLLQWKPTALWWSEDGLFGLTTGPFFTQAAKDSPTLATGYFFTIWQRANTHMPFKFVVDAGVQMTPGVSPSAFVSAPVEKGIIVRSKAIRKGPSAVHQIATTTSEAFLDKAGKESLGLALKSYMQQNSFLLVSDLGKLSPATVGTVLALNRKYKFQRTDQKRLSTYCYYEWGQFRSAEGHPDGSGYYVHVWHTSAAKPLLLAAVYKFDQSLKP